MTLDYQGAQREDVEVLTSQALLFRLFLSPYLALYLFPA